MKRKFVKLTAMVLATAVLTGCAGSSGSNPNEDLDLNSMTVEEITERHRKKGR